ncbi:MAG: DUF2304 domain-containing protein [Candidatus Nanopelagicales bacterium]|jgi:hypothetical protein|nr:DUF2304 domain-containing protein [Candidatus Nanopelagicales bacterium]
MGINWVGLVASLLLAAFVAELLRRGILRERFAALWVAVSALLVVVALAPGLLRWAADTLGFELPANLLFFAAILFLLLVVVQLSYEVSKLEARTRRLAEDLALLRAEVHDGPTASADGPSTS